MTDRLPSLEVARMYDPDLNIYTLFCGDKSLGVYLPMASGDYGIITYIDTVPGCVRVPGSTTALYTEALGLMQESSREIGTQICYLYNTSTPRMVYWGRVYGREIFDWEILKDTDKDFRARRLFDPSD